MKQLIYDTKLLIYYYLSIDELIYIFNLNFDSKLISKVRLNKIKNIIKNYINKTYFSEGRHIDKFLFEYWRNKLEPHSIIDLIDINKFDILSSHNYDKNIQIKWRYECLYDINTKYAVHKPHGYRRVDYIIHPKHH